MTTLVGDQLYLWLEPVLLPVNVNIGVADDKNRIELQLGVMDKKIQYTKPPEHLLPASSWF